MRLFVNYNGKDVDTLPAGVMIWAAGLGVKYNWSSTQILQVLVIKYKYFEFSPIKYSSTSSTDTPSTSTSVNIGWLICTGEYQGGISREIPPCPMITPVQYPLSGKYREIQKGMYTCEY